MSSTASIADSASDRAVEPCRVVYLNGQFLPPEEARIPVLDRGFIFGDGVYEVIPVYQGCAFRLSQHLDRLAANLDALKLPDPHTRAQWRQLIERVIGYQGFADQSLYLQVTRGVAKRDHAFPAHAKPTVFIMSNPLSTPAPALLERGVSAVTLADNRWLRCDIKTTALLGNVLLRQAAVGAEAAECVLLRDGFLTEGSSSNIFAVSEGVLLSPPKSHLILPGITYDLVLELAREHKVAHQVRRIAESELRAAEELMLTSSTREILPITRLDGQLVGGGAPGPVTQRLIELFGDYKRAFVAEARQAAQAS